jgi:hypothetical protein
VCLCSHDCLQLGKLRKKLVKAQDIDFGLLGQGPGLEAGSERSDDLDAGRVSRAHQHSLLKGRSLGKVLILERKANDVHFEKKCSFFYRRKGPNLA